MKISAVLVLIGANVAAYLVQLSTNHQLEFSLALWPLQALEGHVYFRPWQVITYSFLHDPDNKFHLLFNMLQLWMVGAELERNVGSARLLACYFASVVTAALAQLIVPFVIAGPTGPTLGASGGVFGLLLAYAMMFPNRKVVLLILPIPMPAWLFAVILATLELVLGVTGTFSGIAHFAHLGGLVGAALVVTGGACLG